MINKKITSTIKEQVYNIIKEEILSGKISPGTRLQEIELSERLSVSRSPVREALKELSGEGILVNIPNRGVFVRKLTEKDIIDIFELRIVLEKYAIEKCIDKMTDKNKITLRNIYKRMEDAFNANDLHLYIKIDTELHNTLIYLSGNLIVNEVNEKIHSMLQPFRTLSLTSKKRFSESLIEHKIIINEILNNNSDLAWKEDLKHLNLAKKEILEYMQKSKD